MNKELKSVSFICQLLIILILICLASTTILAAQKKQNFSKSEINYLIKTFYKDEFNIYFLNKIFRDKRLKYSPRLVKQNLVNKENKNHYKAFQSKSAVKSAYNFSRKWRTVLNKASNKFYVDKEVIIAILYIETGFGRNLGRHSVISTFSSIFLENYGKRKLRIIRKLATNKTGRNYYRKRLAEKSDWAKNELKSLLILNEQRNLDLYKLKGSYAGAFGISQFLPSTLIRWGFDSDNNGSINLFSTPDAIYSTANYLKSFGWRRGLYLKSNEKVIWEYNHSNNYVTAVIGLARKLRKYSVKRSKLRRGLKKKG